MYMNPFIQTAIDLLKQHEFHLVLSLFRDSLFLVIGILVVLVLLHVLYYLGQRSPIYRRKPPVANWSRRFFPALFGLVVALLLVIWGLNWLLDFRP